MPYNANFKRIGHVDNMTDIELSLRFWRLIDVQYHGENMYVGMAENALSTMTNPYAIKLLTDKIAEFNHIHAS